MKTLTKQTKDKFAPRKKSCIGVFLLFFVDFRQENFQGIKIFMHVAPNKNFPAVCFRWTEIIF